MARKTVMPARKGCPKGEGFGNNKHQWLHSISWNGNSKRVLPFHEGTSGIARSGWRCYHCGDMRWDESDELFALKFAYYAPGHLPYAIKQFITTGKPFQIIADGKLISVGEDENEKVA